MKPFTDKIDQNILMMPSTKEENHKKYMRKKEKKSVYCNICGDKFHQHNRFERFCFKCKKKVKFIFILKVSNLELTAW